MYVSIHIYIYITLTRSHPHGNIFTTSHANTIAHVFNTILASSQ